MNLDDNLKMIFSETLKDNSINNEKIKNEDINTIDIINDLNNFINSMGYILSLGFLHNK